jgi:hypothetical protein
MEKPAWKMSADELLNFMQSGKPHYCCRSRWIGPDGTLLTNDIEDTERFHVENTVERLRAKYPTATFSPIYGPLYGPGPLIESPAPEGPARA